MNDLELGRLLRMLRLRRGLRLEDLRERTGLSTAVLSRQEHGVMTSLTTLRRHAAGLDLRVEHRVRGRGADIPRLVDDEHAAIVNALAAGFRRGGWRLEVEASFNRFGERGRIDLLAEHDDARVLMPMEVKPELADLQDLFGGMNVKTRLAPGIARDLGWPEARVVPALAVAATDRNRQVVTEHAALFANFERRWFRRTVPIPTGEALLLWVPARSAGRQRWLAGRRRIRR